MVKHLKIQTASEQLLVNSLDEQLRSIEQIEQKDNNWANRVKSTDQ